jgi:hypothetical protein
MISRCKNEYNTSYNNYGARGIKVCDRWLDFENFYIDMGPRPSPKHSIDRIDVNGNYEPSNCRWATLEEQMNNTSRNVFYEYKGEKLTIAQLARKYNIPVTTLANRLLDGKSISEAIETPIRSMRENRTFTIDGIEYKTSELADKYNLHVSTINRRLREGKTIEEAISSNVKPA